MSLPALQLIDLNVKTPVSVYLEKVAAVCPFIEPAGRAGLLSGCVVTPDCQAPDDIHARIFEEIVPQIERFRDIRRVLPEKQQRLLICHTVVIHMLPSLDIETARVLAWPNWLSWSLKQLYTSKELVFGIVRKGVAELSTFGIPIPVSPFHAVIIRSRVMNSDQRFFPNNQPLLQAMMEADDDGQDAHTPIFGQVPDIRSPQAMRDAGYFKQVQQWGQKVVSESKANRRK